MKKNHAIIGVLALALFLSACGTEQNNGKDSNVPIDTGLSASNSIQLNKQEIPASDALINNSEVVEPETNDKEIASDSTRVISGQEDLFKNYSGAIIKTSEGDIAIQFYSDTPITVNNFMNLAKKGFYDNTKFHRVMKDFMIQGGDPLTKESNASVYGTGGPGYQFKNEASEHKLVAGNIAMANAGMNTNGSQFFIVTVDSAPFLDGGYTNFGEVLGDMSSVRRIENSAVKESATGEMSVPVDYVTVKSIKLVK